MEISILISNKNHPIYLKLLGWISEKKEAHDISLFTSKDKLEGGDLLFLISCHEIIDSNIRRKYQSTLVIHASDLPEGRGWSPHVWQILEGRNKVTVSLLEAVDGVDSGAIWAKKTFVLSGSELADEINLKLFDVELKLLDFAVDNFLTVKPIQQDESEATYYPKRTPDDSRLDPNKTIAEQFDALRVADQARYPTFFTYRGCSYKIKLEKIDKVNE